MKNRMRELRTCGTVRGEGREALTYSENVLSGTLSTRKSLISSCLDTHQIGRKLQAF